MSGISEVPDMLSQAITKIENRVLPGLNTDRVMTSEPHMQLLPLLQVFELADEHTREQVKFIYDYLMENGGNPKDQIVSLHSKLGADKGNSLVGRVWKYLKLKAEANKALARYENIQKDLSAFSSDN